MSSGWNANYATRGQGNAGVVGAVLGGTALAGVLSQNNGCGNNGLFGGLFGNNNNNCYVTKEENALSTALAIAQSEKESALQSKNDIERLFQELRTQDAKIADGLIQTGNAVGVLNAEVACLKESVNRNREESFRNLNEAKGYTDTRVSAEASLRQCEDEKILVYTNGQLEQKVDWSKRIDSRLLCNTDCCV